MSAFHPGITFLVALVGYIVLIAYHMYILVIRWESARNKISASLFHGSLVTITCVLLYVYCERITAYSAVQIPLERSGDREYRQEVWLQMSPNEYAFALICGPAGDANSEAPPERIMIDLSFTILVNGKVVAEGSERKGFSLHPSVAMHFPLFRRMTVHSSGDIVHVVAYATISEIQSEAPALQFMIHTPDELKTKAYGISLKERSYGASAIDFEGDFGGVTYERED